MKMVYGGVFMVAVASVAFGAELQITSFSRNGELKWSAENTNLFYQVQWAASLTNGWQSNYSQLNDIRISSTNGQTAVPMFYKMVATSNRTVFAAPVPRTMFSQDASYDDGYFSKGADWPNPRFSIGTGLAANCVLDNLTGLMWLKNPDSTKRGWFDALIYCHELNGDDGRGGFTDWRLPNIRELMSVLDFRYSTPALCNTAGTAKWTSGNPFLNIKTTAYYWSSTTRVSPDANYAWGISMTAGDTDPLNKFVSPESAYYVWPVRGGQ